MELSNAEWEVLNATCDDYENVEQIFISVCFEVTSEKDHSADPTAVWLRKRSNAPSLAELILAIKSLIERRFLDARDESGASISSITGDSFIWDAWFHTTEVGIVAMKAIRPDSR